MTDIFIANLAADVSSINLDLLVYFFNDGILKRIANSPNENYKLKRITSRLMLIQVFKELGISTNKLKNIHYNKYGKLVLDDEKCSISLSYSNNKVVCLVSTDKIGMDVENINAQPKTFHVGLLEKLTKKNINSKMDFYYLWTEIESIVKIYDDKGLKDIFYGDLFSKKHYTKQILFNQEYLISTSSTKQFEFTGQIKILNV